MDTISVLIPLYNRAGFIAETLSAVEHQSLKPSEVIIIDDHSIDQSVEVVNNFKKTSSLNIIVLKNELHKGQSGALNWGFKKASGNLIALQDSDDLWTPTHLQQLYEALCRHPESNIAFSAIEIFGSAKDTHQKIGNFKISIKRCLDHAFEKGPHGIWVSNQKLLYNLLMHGVPFRCPASLIRKEFVIKHGLHFDTDITYTQDSHFMTLAAYFTSFLYVDTIGLRIRRHAENDGDLGYGDKIKISYGFRARRLKKFFSEHPISREEKKALDHRLWDLQSYVACQEASGKGLKHRTKTAFGLLKDVPTRKSVKSAVKLLMGKKV